MVNLFDIMKQAQSGAAIDLLGRQFGLNPYQATQAVEALLPAFTLGLQRIALNPVAFGQFLGLMNSGRYAPFFDANPASSAASGQHVVEALFGSPEVSRQIAAQASAMTGIAAQILQQMMPLLAATLMGGLAKFASVEGLSDVLRKWADWLQSLKPDEPKRRPAGGDPAAQIYAAWADLMGGMLGVPRSAPPAPAPDPWSRLTDAMLGKVPAPPAPPPPSQPNPFETLAHMFETGREVQSQHLANLQSIFGGMWGAKPAA